MGSMDTLCYIFKLQKIFDNLNINYCMLSYFPIENTQENKIFVKNNIDLTKFITYDDSNHPLFYGFIDLMKNNNLTKDEEKPFTKRSYVFI